MLNNQEKSTLVIKVRSIKHGLSRHKIYDVWSQMIKRCNNVQNRSYKNYGGRGIKVCERWMDVRNFIDDMYPTFEDGLSIDRIDVNGNYNQSNCRWVTQEIQARNKRILQCNNTSGYRGVSKNKKTGRWESRIRINSKLKHLGSYATALDGAKAYDMFVIENNLEHTLNKIN